MPCGLPKSAALNKNSLLSTITAAHPFSHKQCQKKSSHRIPFLGGTACKLKLAISRWRESVGAHSHCHCVAAQSIFFKQRLVLQHSRKVRQRAHVFGMQRTPFAKPRHCDFARDEMRLPGLPKEKAPPTTLVRRRSLSACAQFQALRQPSKRPSRAPVPRFVSSRGESADEEEDEARSWVKRKESAPAPPARQDAPVEKTCPDF